MRFGTEAMLSEYEVAMPSYFVEYAREAGAFEAEASA